MQLYRSAANVNIRYSKTLIQHAARSRIRFDAPVIVLTQRGKYYVLTHWRLSVVRHTSWSFLTIVCVHLEKLNNDGIAEEGVKKEDWQSDNHAYTNVYVIASQIKQHKHFKLTNVLQPEQVIILSQPNTCVIYLR